MTNSDRLQEIRERAEKIQKKAILAENGQSIVVAHTFVSWGDFTFLLQLVTEQQREIERLGNYHAELNNLRINIENMASHTEEKWKASGLEAVATMLRMWHIEGVQEMKQELRALKNPRKLKIEGEQNPPEALEQAIEAKGYRKQERPM